MEPSKAEKVLTLTEELMEVKKDKKVSNKTYNDEIKRITAEIQDLLDEKQTVTKDSKQN